MPRDMQERRFPNHWTITARISPSRNRDVGPSQGRGLTEAVLNVRALEANSPFEPRGVRS